MSSPLVHGRLSIPLWGLLTTMSILPVAGAGASSKDTAVAHVDNGAKPQNGLRTLPTTELWRRGGETDDVLFGSIARIIADDDGNLYVLDSQLSQVTVFSHTGAYLRTIMHEGDGPGEIRYPADIFFLPDGTLGAVQQYPGKIVRVEQDGTPAGGFDWGNGAGNFAILQRALSGGRQIVLGGIDIAYDASGNSVQTYFLASCDSNGIEITRYYERECARTYNEDGLTESELDAPWTRVVLSSTGYCYLAPERNVYRIKVFDPLGNLERTVCRTFESLQRTSAEAERARRRIEAYARHYPSGITDIRIEDTEPDIASMVAMSTGELWVRSSRGNRGNSAGLTLVYDVFDAHGRFHEQVNLDAPVNTTHDLVFFVDDDRIVVVRWGVDAALALEGAASPKDAAEDAEPMEIICYEIGASKTVLR